VRPPQSSSRRQQPFEYLVEMVTTGIQPSLSFSFLTLRIERTPEEARHTPALFAAGRNSRHRAPWSLLEKPVLVITLLHERKVAPKTST
jgi:hypothetical protein